jgi:hypothetical protein
MPVWGFAAVLNALQLLAALAKLRMVFQVLRLDHFTCRNNTNTRWFYRPRLHCVWLGLLPLREGASPNSGPNRWRLIELAAFGRLSLDHAGCPMKRADVGHSPNLPTPQHVTSNSPEKCGDRLQEEEAA